MVGGIAQDGFVAPYSNPGANLLVVAPTGEQLGVVADAPWTADVLGNGGFSTNAAPSANGTSFTTFSGTSASAPLVAGVIALMYDANPDLGWRDVREILAASAMHVGSGYDAAPNTGQSEKRSWTSNGATDWNGGGHYFSEDYGFGLVDAHAAVRLAETWTEQKTSANEQSRSASGGSIAIPDNGAAGLVMQMAAGVTVETVTVEINFQSPHPRVSDLSSR